MNISYTGYNTKFLTVPTTTDITVGYPLCFKADGTVIHAETGKDFVGVAVSCRDGVVGMQEEGYVEMPYTGTAPTYGYCKLVCAGNEKVKVGTADTDKKYKVIMVDTTNNIVGFKL